MNNGAKIPEGYRANALGHLVPESNIGEIDKLRDELVMDMIVKAKNRAYEMSCFKNECHEKIASFIEVSAQDHGIAMGGKKGNVTLTSFDGQYRVLRAIDEAIQFSEGLVVAREMIDRCIQRWTEGANVNLVALVVKAFETDKAGNLSTARVLGLASVKVDDEEWNKAMDLIHKSIQVSATKSYLRFYERDAVGHYVQIPLDGGQ